MGTRRALTLAAMASAMLVLSGCGVGAGHPHDPEAQMHPELLLIASQPIAAGEQFEVTFPEETTRGVAWVLEEPDGNSWNLRWFIAAGSEQYDGSRTPSWWAYEDREGTGWVDVGLGGPGPDMLVVPDEAAPGTYRLCTANSGDNICTEIEVGEV